VARALESPAEAQNGRQGQGGAAPIGRGVPQAVRDAVRSHFAVYEAHEDAEVGTYFVHEAPEEIEDRFERLRVDLLSLSYSATIRAEGGERILNVFPKGRLPSRRPLINITLLAATLLTTTVAGAFAAFGYLNPDFCYSCYGPESALLPLGRAFMWAGFVQFAFPLMLILGVHEMGHFVASKVHGLSPSFPYFIPLPPLFAVNIGTLGAFISLREPIPSRKALFDIGAAGPIAGLVIAVPVVLLGSFLMAVDPVEIVDEGGTVFLGTPLLFDALAAPFDISDTAIIHPVALAGWVGLLVTGINLLPAGQLDGGHIATAWLGRSAAMLSSIALGVLILLGLGIPPFSEDQFIPGYGGWLIFAVLILFLGTRHPPTLDNITGLDPRRTALAVGSLMLAVVCFTPNPIS